MIRYDGLDLIDPVYCWGLESNSEIDFLWTRQVFRLTPPVTNARFMTMKFASLVAENNLRVRIADQDECIELLQGWQLLDIEVGGGAEVCFELTHAFRPEADDRTLGLMLSSLSFHSDARKHASIRARHANSILNQREYRSGSETLESVPPYLRVTLSKACNIANETPCVYCSWDWAKRMEQGSPDFTPDFIEGMGKFLERALEITDCSYGEPLLAPEFEQILALLAPAERPFEFTSNGQPLSAKARSLLLGKNLRLYVSLDAATSEGYQRLRDHRFDLIINNLRALCAEKRDHANQPEVILSFIVMRSNRHQLRAFFQLAKTVGVDRLNFRSLFREDHLESRTITHYGQRFDYEHELLGLEELQQAGQECLALAMEFAINITIDWDAFVRNNSSCDSNEPLCSEPWKTAYILNRGITPCCFGREPLVSWSDIAIENGLESELHSVLNSQPFVELRKDLASGQLGQYCRRTSGCPIVSAIKKK